MADISITDASVNLTSGQTNTLDAGETIAAGDLLYLNSTDNKVYQASNVTSVSTATVIGMALNNAGADQPVTYVMNGGVINIGAVLTVGTVYVLSEAGLMAPDTDRASNDYVSVIAIPSTTSILELTIINSGVQVP